VRISSRHLGPPTEFAADQMHLFKRHVTADETITQLDRALDRGGANT
jgi:hypothetical protein